LPPKRSLFCSFWRLNNMLYSSFIHSHIFMDKIKMISCAAPPPFCRSIIMSHYGFLLADVLFSSTSIYAYIYFPYPNLVTFLSPLLCIVKPPSEKSLLSYPCFFFLSYLLLSPHSVSLILPHPSFSSRLLFPSPYLSSFSSPLLFLISFSLILPFFPSPLPFYVPISFSLILPFLPFLFSPSIPYLLFPHHSLSSFSSPLFPLSFSLILLFLPSPLPFYSPYLIFLYPSPFFLLLSPSIPSLLFDHLFVFLPLAYLLSPSLPFLLYISKPISPSFHSLRFPPFSVSSHSSPSFAPLTQFPSSFYFCLPLSFSFSPFPHPSVSFYPSLCFFTLTFSLIYFIFLFFLILFLLLTPLSSFLNGSLAFPTISLLLLIFFYNIYLCSPSYPLLSF
jgi:hypothetical protein